MKIYELKSLLHQSGYDKRKSDYLINGFENGFSIGYDRPQDVQHRSPNLKFRGVGNKTILWNKVMKEVKLGCFPGPFKEIPFKNFIQSQIGLVPKDDRKTTRLIFHLSYPQGKNSWLVNANTDKALCSVTYPSFDRAVQLCIAARKCCMTAKSDMTSAFRHLRIKKLHWKFLVMMAESPINKKIYFFVDKCLPFGSSISCAHFQEFSNAVAYLVHWKTK